MESGSIINPITKKSIKIGGKVYNNLIFDIKERIKYITEKIDNVENVLGLFNQLLFTHNTNIPTFLHMLLGDYSFIRCCEINKLGREIPYRRGAQFRYGLDSQYGEIKLIMKPNFWKHYKRGITYSEEFINHPNFYDFWSDVEYKDNNKELKILLESQAINYNFRFLDQNRNLINEGGNECIRYSEEILSNPKQILKSGYPSWCNIQLHIGDNVSYDDILAVIVPGILKYDSNIIFKGQSQNININELISNAQNNDFLANGKLNPFKGKIIFTDSQCGSLCKYYGYFDNESRIKHDFYSQILKDEINFNNFMQRSSIHGNSSILAVSSEEFIREQQVYMKLLLLVGYYVL